MRFRNALPASGIAAILAGCGARMHVPKRIFAESRPNAH